MREVTPPDAGEGPWHLAIEGDGGSASESFDLVVVCVGFYSNIPHLPEIDGREGFGGEVLHISDPKSAEALAGKRAVVGFGKSGTDAALAPHARSRCRHRRAPLALAGAPQARRCPAP